MRKVSEDMNDRHLFKAKRLFDSSWVIGNLVNYQSGEVAILESAFSKYGREATEIINRTKVDPATICQCTGLKDKNGRLIWEGDIFKFLNCKGVVEWDDENGRYIGFTLENERKIVYVGRDPKVEVIGNKFDNPELLEVQE